MSTVPATSVWSEALPEHLELSIGLTAEELPQHLRMMAAIKLFELAKVSSGKAAELAGMSRVDFLETCSRYRVSAFNCPPEDLEAEVRGEIAAAERVQAR